MFPPTHKSKEHPGTPVQFVTPNSWRQEQAVPLLARTRHLSSALGTIN
jgi:hypothetical protein